MGAMLAEHSREGGDEVCSSLDPIQSSPCKITSMTKLPAFDLIAPSPPRKTPCIAALLAALSLLWS
jgi:hypothetical protein